MNNKKNNSLFKDIYGVEKGILELKLKDFKYIDKKLYIDNDYFKNRKGFIIFYAPWCKHCKKISDLLIDLALSNINSFNFGAVNGENIEDGNDHVCIYANIEYYPTIMVINDDYSLTKYKFDYNVDNLLYYININT